MISHGKEKRKNIRELSTNHSQKGRYNSEVEEVFSSWRQIEWKGERVRSEIDIPGRCGPFSLSIITAEIRNLSAEDNYLYFPLQLDWFRN